jgi:polysaccharide export outer membrane protein
LHVYGEQALTDSATIDERGSIALPRIGTIPASVLTISELRDTIVARMAVFVRDPAVQVSVLRRIVVGGDVVKPGVYYAELTSTIAEMIAGAGGLKETANASRVYVVRNGTQTRIPDWETSRAPEANPRSGDLIVVGRRSWLSLNLLSFVSVTTTLAALIISLSR